MSLLLMQPQLFRFSKKCLTESQHPLHTERDVRRYTCPVGVSEIINGTEFTNSSFNEGKRSNYTCSNSVYCYLAEKSLSTGQVLPKPIEASNELFYPPLEQLGPERNNALQQQGAIFQTSSQRTHFLPLEQRN